ncbi:MAG: DUF1460 domain-containing protein [Haliscomenobacteraceae bacterium CHB4]|nr:hypothetical protein [Saprospiraceae bacterium]MCE7924300.1 DUF1460 domain-containing protein [Haliscomenobacteraceae bacterium CHB4]
MKFLITRLLGFWLLIFPIQGFHLPDIPLFDNDPAAENPLRKVAYSDRDSFLFSEKQKTVTPETDLGGKTLAIARSFLGTSYVAGTLDMNAEEQLVVNLRQLDCWTLVENSLAIALANEGDFQGYLSNLQQLRYWGGTVDGYGSRIHYFSGWLLQAEKSGFLRDLTREMGGIPYRKKIGYISARPDKYPKMRDAATLRDIQASERRINAHAWYFIPKAKVAAMEHLIEDGDLIMLTSSRRDLDIAHQGFAVRQNGRIHLLNASSLAKKVVISRQTLTQYLAAQKGQSGIMVARLTD